MKVFVKYNPVIDTTEIYITEKDSKGRKFVAKPMNLEFEPMDSGKHHEPSLTISAPFNDATDFLKNLATALTKAGYQPEVEQELKGELKATKYHLEDLRQLTIGINNKIEENK